MLEALTHKYLKEFLFKYPSDWDHIYSFGRIIARFLRKRENLLINSEIFLTEKWYVGALMALFLNEEDSILVSSSVKSKSMIKNYLPLLREFGFEFLIQNNQIIFARHKILLLTIDTLLNHHNKLNFQNQNILFAEVDNIQKDLNKKFRVTFTKKDWLNFSDEFLGQNNELIESYNTLKKYFFLKAVPNQIFVSLKIDETELLNKIIDKYADYSDKFVKLKRAILSRWAFWVILDYDKFEWSLQSEPINQIEEIKELLVQNNMIFLSSYRKDNFILKHFKKFDIKIKSAITFSSCFAEQNILIYVPRRLVLPNNPTFVQSTINKCIKFSLLSKGVAIFLSNDTNFKMRLATELAAIYGYRILLENYPKFDNQIICCSYDWWIDNLHLISPPEHIIIPLLPLPNMETPKNKITVEFIKSNSDDWFREFILPESFQKIDQAISPLRKNAGNLIFLDGRINNRKWGRDILKMIQPKKEINCILPFD